MYAIFMLKTYILIFLLKQGYIKILFYKNV